MATSYEVERLLWQGQAAFRAERWQEARRCFQQAAALDPQCEEVWLWLAGVSASPHARLAYLSRALSINPHNARARQGLEWSLKQARVNGQSPAANSAWRAARSVQRAPSSAQRATRGAANATSSARRATYGTWRATSSARRITTTARRSPVTIRTVVAAIAACVFTLACLLLSSTFALDTPSPIAEAAWQNGPALGLGPTEIAMLVGSPTPTFTPTHTPTSTPTHTPTNTPTFTPTNTPTPTPTFTPTFTPTPTPTDTPTPTPTNTPLPTNTRLPTNTPWPTWTPRPYVPPTQPPAPDLGVRWIDVNLSYQRVIAYEGGTAVNSFIVSTGLPNTPTVTGYFNIYAKITSQLMTGPGYYLPDVPWVMYFYGGYSFHGTYWHNNFGHPMSHGCVNMRTDEALWLFNWAPMGTLVYVHY